MTHEIDKFNKLADSWWDPAGPMAPLHWMNPARLDFIHRHLSAAGTKPPANGLDIGCGAGLLTEPLARFGFNMTGLDGAEDALTVARAHARPESLSIDYRHGMTGDLRRSKEKFDFVTALEIIEHVDDPKESIDDIVSLSKQNSLIFFSTLNRTLKSRIFSIYLAEYVLRALPIGTHDYAKFIRPAELVQMLEKAGCEIIQLQGMVFNPLKRSFALSDHDLDINYILCARKL